MLTRKVRTLLVPALTGMSAACAAGSSADVVVRDSAGIRLVENRGADSGWRRGPRWRAVADLTIGSDSGDAAYQFGRIGDVAVTATGDIVVVDQLAGQLRVFDSNGVFKRAIGRPGKGPGELSRQTNAVFPIAGDSLLVPDPGERRITVFAPDGTLGRVVLIPPRPTAQSWVLLPDGRSLMRGLTIGRDAAGSFLFWDALIALSADGVRSDTIFTFDYTKTDLGAPGRLRIQLLVNNPSWARLADGRIAWTALDRDFVTVVDSRGHPVARFSHAQWKTRPVTPDDRSAMVELLRTKLRMIGGDASFADSPQVEAPPRFPAITAVKAGPDGSIWVQRMGPVRAIDPMAINAPDRADFLGGSIWDVLDKDGHRLGAITLPARFRIFRILPDAVYGAARDDNGVEHIERLRLQRGP